MRASCERLIVATLILVPGLPLTALSADLDVGREVYSNSCAVCHGSSGQPDASSPVVEGLGVMPANFSDPLFNSREPAGDWQMVINHGGQALGLAAQMPAQGDVLTDQEITAVTAYLKTMADTSEYPPGEMNLFLPTRTKKAFPEDEFVYKGRFTDQAGEDSFKNVLEYEKRIGKRGQAILEIVQESEGNVSELAAAEVGYKQAISYSNTHILSAAGVVAVPVEAEGDGELQTYLAYGRILSSDWILQSSLRLKFPFEDFDDGSAELAGIVHWVHSPWPRRVYPGLEVVAERPFRSANGDIEWTAMPQVRIGLTRGGHVALNLGVEVPLSDQAWDERFYITLLWDFADGSFFQGW